MKMNCKVHIALVNNLFLSIRRVSEAYIDGD